MNSDGVLSRSRDTHTCTHLQKLPVSQCLTLSLAFRFMSSNKLFFLELASLCVILLASESGKYIDLGTVLDDGLLSKYVFVASLI